MKSLPLTYNRDLQEVKPPLFNAIDTAKSCLSMISQVLSGIKVNEKEIARSLDTGFMNATDMADYLAKKGMPFREAHGITRKIVSYCIRKKKTLTELSLEELKTFSEMFEEDVFPHLTIESCVNSKTSPGGTSLTRVKTSIEHAEKILKENIASYRKISDLSSKPLQLLERGIGEIL
jgi:argininosuccinate lyase